MSAAVEQAWARLPATARRLLAAGLEAFGENGYHGTSTRAIALRAGMSPAALYMHFPTKEDLLFEIARTGHKVHFGLVRQAAEAAGPDPAARVAAIVEASVLFHAEHHSLARTIQYEHPSLTPDHQRELVKIRRETESLLADAVAEGVAAGAFAPDDAATAALALMSLAIDVARWYPSQRRRDPAHIAASYTRLALRLLRP
ncbi:TetR/AcrR family transcriptional regulator [Actinocorallia sp. A-T 12471]|uniref:TetR/AcrR family transcriptional regulator n=1 Tax=Actinocorallia sp. A-T 12471 TaxID=3089813 RepID=UPI0029CD4C15|nr:TetR/AcrR family transcriptional regulator [Actinocorallia sp. A-T 12471]MDX6740045.1 TetR/AcrR family transcriptional regulator [Actinocorallia sp. A-T 12471]